MAVINQEVTNLYAVYNADCIEVMQTLPAASIHMSIYSPPFCGLYHYSSSERDLSNCRTYEEFFVHYGFVIDELARITKPGRFTCVHCMDVPKKGANIGGYIDFPGDIIRAHEARGFEYWTRRHVYKEPLGVRRRTMLQGLAHMQICDDATLSTVATADYVLEFRRVGENAEPVAYPTGLDRYAGEREIPHDVLRFRHMEGDQKKNKYSHWIWRQYASDNWDDIRIDNVWRYKEARDPEDEKHCHPLQRDVIERCCVLRSNPGDIVLTPFMGVGSEVCDALINDRRAIGIELKPTYYRQALQNIQAALHGEDGEQMELGLDVVDDTKTPFDEAM